MGDKSDQTQVKRSNTRISAACSPCRAKKQKCSGEKPKCEQCQAAGRECEWPKQIKRGPSKDYIRTLESKLRQTEEILLRLLPLVSDEQLSSVLADETLPSSTPVVAAFDAARNPIAAYIDREHSPMSHLRSSEDLRAWYRQRTTRDSIPDDQAPASRSAHRETAGGHQRTDSYSNSENMPNVDEEEQISVDMSQHVPPSPYVPFTTGIGSGTMSITTYLPTYHNLSGHAFGSHVVPQESNVRAINTSESLLMSPSFQEQFIW